MTTRKTKSTTPLPGTPVRGSRTGRPIMALLDLIGRRWTLRVLWELRAEPARFEELRGRCDEMSTSVLATRLKELEDADLVKLHSLRMDRSRSSRNCIRRRDGMRRKRDSHCFVCWLRSRNGHSDGLTGSLPTNGTNVVSVAEIRGHTMAASRASS